MTIDRYATRKLSQDTGNQFQALFYSKISETTYQSPVTLYRVIENRKQQDLTGGGRFQTKKQRNFRIYQSDLSQAIINAGLVPFYPKTDDVLVPLDGIQYVVTDSVDKELHGQEWCLVCQQATGPIQLILNVVPPFATTWDQITVPTVWNNWLQNWGL